MRKTKPWAISSKSISNIKIYYSSKKEDKVKVVKKKDMNTFEEKEISNIIVPEIKQEDKKLDSWVPVSEEAALAYKNEFKLEDHLDDFESLTDENLNKKLKEVSPFLKFRKSRNSLQSRKSRRRLKVLRKPRSRKLPNS